MKRSNVHEVTLRAVHVFMSSFSETVNAVNSASVAHFSVCNQIRMFVPFAYRDVLNSYLNSLFAA